MQSTGNEGRQRLFDKQFPCFFCNQLQSQIQRHLRDLHGTEPEVQAIQAEDDPQKRQNMMSFLRNKGTHIHNCNVIREGKGVLIVVYRPTVPDANYQDYGPCEFCYGYYVRLDLWKHNCPHRSQTHVLYSNRPAVNSKYLLPPALGESNQELHTITQRLKNDDISRVAKSDSLIMDYADRQMLASGHDPEKHGEIRGKMRTSARLLMELRQLAKNPEACMKDFINPTQFRNVVAAVKRVSGYNDNTHEYATPSLALKLGHTLKKFAMIVLGKGAENGDDVMCKNASLFTERMKCDWSVFVSSGALRTLRENKRNKPTMLPLTEDVMKMNKLLKEVGRDSFSALQSCNVSSAVLEEAWRDLEEVTLATLILFNRRRTGEVSKMLVKDVPKVVHVQDSAIVESLSPVEKELCKVLKRVEIVGKRGRTVPVLLTGEIESWLDELGQKRSLLHGINKDNPYVFPCTYFGSMGHIRGADVLRDFSLRCKAKFPDTLTGTNLRKHLATLCQILNLRENEMDMIAKFLGHDLRVHRDYYRLPCDILEVSKVAKLLLAVEKGGAALGRGTNLDDIPLNDKGNEV